MTWCDTWTSLLINLIAGFFIFLLGLFWPVIPKSYRKYLLRKFWGKGVLSQNFIISYGALTDLRLTVPNPPTYRYQKSYHDGRSIQLVGPYGKIVGDCEVRSFSYLINTISEFRETAIPVISDNEAYSNLNRTIVSIGSPSSNELSDLIMRESNNVFLHFRQDSNDVYIEEKTTCNKFRGFLPPVKKDYGIILKIRNQRFPRYYFFVCAGLGEWGTSGSAWYLASKWKELLKREEFGLVVEVEIGSDESTRIVFPQNGI